MALNNYLDIPEWEMPDRDPDTAVPVAREIPPPQPTATRIGIGKDGQVELFEEVGIELLRGRHLDLSTAPEYSGCPRQLPNTIEVRGAAKRWDAKYTVVTAAYPYGADWFAHSRFKPTRYEGSRREPEATQAALTLIQRIQESDDPQAVLEEADFDPFETGEKWVTARFFGPFNRTPGSHVTVRTRAKHKQNLSNPEVFLAAPNRTLTSRTRRDEDNLETLQKLPLTSLWAICEDLDRCYQLLIESGEVRQILENPESVLSNSGFRAKRPSYVIQNERMLELFCSLARPGMHSAIMKALAGVPPRPGLWKQGERRLAIDLVLEIFRDFALNLAKRLGGERVCLAPFKDTDGASTHPGVEPDSHRTEGRNGTISGLDVLPDEVQDREWEWKQNLESTALSADTEKIWFEVIRQKIESEDDKKIIDGCGMIAASLGLLNLPEWIFVRLRTLARNSKEPRLVRSFHYVLRLIAMED